MVKFTVEMTEVSAIQEANWKGEFLPDWSDKRCLDFITHKMSNSRFEATIKDSDIPAFLARIKIDGYEVVGAKCIDRS